MVYESGVDIITECALPICVQICLLHECTARIR